MLARLKDYEMTRTLTAEEMIERAFCIWSLDGPAASEPFFRSAQATYPSNPEADLNLGRCLLAQDKVEGIALIEPVISRVSSQVRSEATVAVCEYLRRNERNAEAIAFFNRMAREEEAQRKSAFERSNLSPDDRLIWHGLDAQRLAEISRKLQTLDWVLAAFFCRKPTSLSPDRPLYLLVLKPRHGFLIPAFRPGMTAFDQVAALNCYPTETRFLLLDGSHPTLEKEIRKLPYSLLFKR